ncbi:MAG: hypothetical protein HYV07_23025 [Deltaproteobacteria bacterium]|nr:hypothetical protein [Deltaproteobacteria bacterium]
MISRLLPFVAATIAATANAQESEEARAFRNAKNAFEYRDFSKVRQILWPWIHPPRIVDPVIMIEAREILGISLHIEGLVDAAKEEFGQILLSDPNRQLDPFLVPPQVIEAFEETRRALRPTLDRVRAERGEMEHPVDHGIQPWMPWLIPLGLTQLLVLEEPGWGALWMGLQIAGLATNVGSYWAARGLVDARGNVEAPELARFEAFQAVQVIGLVALAVGLVGAGIEGQLEISARRAEARKGSSPAQGSGVSFSF